MYGNNSRSDLVGGTPDAAGRQHPLLGSSTFLVPLSLLGLSAVRKSRSSAPTSTPLCAHTQDFARRLRLDSRLNAREHRFPFDVSMELWEHHRIGG